MNLSHKTIKTLRQEGWKCKIHHYRHVKEGDNGITRYVPLMDIQNRSKCSPTGGVTKLYLTSPEGKEYHAKAGCVSSDPFCYKKGVLIALGKLEEIKS